MSSIRRESSLKRKENSLGETKEEEKKLDINSSIGRKIEMFVKRFQKVNLNKTYPNIAKITGRSPKHFYPDNLDIKARRLMMDTFYLPKSQIDVILNSHSSSSSGKSNSRSSGTSNSGSIMITKKQKVVRSNNSKKSETIRIKRQVLCPQGDLVHFLNTQGVWAFKLTMTRTRKRDGTFLNYLIHGKRKMLLDEKYKEFDKLYFGKLLYNIANEYVKKRYRRRCIVVVLMDYYIFSKNQNKMFRHQSFILYHLEFKKLNISDRKSAYDLIANVYPYDPHGRIDKTVGKIAYTVIPNFTRHICESTFPQGASFRTLHKTYKSISPVGLQIQIGAVENGYCFVIVALMIYHITTGLNEPSGQRSFPKWLPLVEKFYIDKFGLSGKHVSLEAQQRCYDFLVEFAVSFSYGVYFMKDVDERYNRLRVSPLIKAIKQSQTMSLENSK
jgi:hypothetical protein